MNTKSIVEQIFNAAVQSVLPGKMIRDQVSVSDSTLTISNLKFSLNDIDCIYIIGAGKASALMAKEIENILGERITQGHVVVKYGHSCELKHIKVTEAGHPIPDNNSVIAADEILEIAIKASEKDIFICLLSGGGSSVMTDCPDGVTLAEIITLNNLLLKSGADIKDINTVRKHLSKVKGGKLAKAVYPATLIGLILSDVVGDSIDVIASGPTVHDFTTYQDAMAILTKYNINREVPLSIINYLKKGAGGLYSAPPDSNSEYFKNIYNFIVGSNKIALKAAKNKSDEMGLHSIIVTDELEGDSVKAADYMIETALKIQKDKKIQKPVCLLFGGETTIWINGNGTGGRNQHLALHAALILKGKKGITLLSAGTDGNDGPTNVAGAVVDLTTCEIAAQLNLNIEEYLQNFDSFHFFQKAGGHIITGPTMTNVMDIMIIMVE